MSKSKSGKALEQEKQEAGLPPRPDGFLVTGIGASAGGVQALQEFFEHVPADSGIAYVVILHLSPDHDSQLAGVLRQVSKIPVTKVTERVRVQPNHVYVVPPDRHLAMDDGQIAVLKNTQTEDRRAPVDIFFRTLADSHQTRAVGVILSGTGANGSMGIKRIKERGGAAFVQNPREAEYSEMPRHAIATELIDEVLPVREIPGKIVAYKERLGIVEIPQQSEQTPEDQQQALREIFTMLRLRTGHDFSNYKRPTLLRRIERRINVRNLASLPMYAAYMHDHPEESVSLLKDLLISVTNFFRDKATFEYIQTNVLPAILARKQTGDSLRIWCIGCATGEEAYSLAMLCAEQTVGVINAPKVQIFASDIDNEAIAVAREGYYTLNDAADVSPERLRRFFNPDGDGYRIRREIREMILFANQNVLKDPPFSHIDLVSCRNLLIYLNSVAQERVMETIHFALEPGGYLFLGSAESAGTAADLFSPLSQEYHVYQARVVGVKQFPVPEAVPSFRFDKTYGGLHVLPESELRAAPSRISYGELHQQLLEQYAPPSLVVNEEYDIVHLTERAGRYLQMGGGEPSQNLLKLIRPELRLELRTALYQAVQRQSNVEARNLKLRMDDHTETINVHVRPVLEAAETVRGFLLVLFEPALQEAQEGEQQIVATDEGMARHLEDEIIRVKAQLRTSIEQYELQNEELKASNEELQAMNEEMRSAAEELETSKEELQSINEELTTVNQDLKVKVEELSMSGSNLQNLINSTDIGTVFLDRSLRVALFTPPARDIFNLIAADIGRPLSDITSKLAYDQLLPDAESVLEKLATVEREITAADGKSYLMRISPYRTEEDRINGVVMTFLDITGRKYAEAAVRRSEEKYRTLFNSIDEGYNLMEVLYDDDGQPYDFRILEANPAFVRITGLSEPAGKTGRELVPGLEQFWIDNAHQVASGGEPLRFEGYMAGLDRWFSVYFSPMETGDRRKVVSVFGDITEGKRAEEALRTSEEKYRSLFESIDEGFCIIERVPGEPADFRYLEANPAFALQSGLGNVVGKTIRQVVPDEPDEWFEIYERVLRTGEPIRFEQGLRSVGGVLDLYAFPVAAQSGRRLAVIFKDVTGRKHLDANLAFLAGVAQDLNRLATPEEMMQSVGKRLAEFLGLSACYFFDVDEASGEVTPLHGWTDEHVPSLLKQTFRLEEYLSEAFAATQRAGTAFVVRDTASDERTDTAGYARLKIGAFVAIPFHRNGEWKGYFAVTTAAPRDWQQDETGLLEEFANQTFPRIERARAQQALRNSEERFRAIINQATAGIAEYDLQGRHIFVNQKFCKLLGYTESEILKLDYRSVVYPEDLPLLEKTFRRTAETGESFMDEKRMLHKDGSYIWVSGTISAITGPDGRPQRIAAIIFEISERKAAEEALRESVERLRITMESAVDYAIIGLSPEGLIESWSRGAERTFGWTEEEVLGQYTALIFTPEDRAAGAPEAELQKALKDGLAPDERWHIRKDGTRFFMSGVARPIYQDGLHGFVKVARDLTAQRQAEERLRVWEERYRIALQSAEMAAWDWYIVDDSLVWNDQHYLLLGLSPDHKHKNLAYFLQFLHRDDLARVQEALQRALNGGYIFAEEYRVLPANTNEPRWMYGFGRVIEFDNQGHAARMVGVMYDIDERKHMEQQKDEFIGIASHELKTPVTSIKAYAEVLEDIFAQAGDVQSAALMQKMNKQVDRLTALIGMLLDITRISQGRLELRKEPFELRALVEEVSEALQHTTTHRLVIESAEPGRVFADRERIAQVLNNLLSNAIKYSPEADRILISIRRTAAGIMQVCVQDFGIGLTEEAQEKVFDRFYRVEQSKMSTYPGMGLGLYISAEIIRQHGGRIWTESQVGEGSTFCFTLPANDA